MADDTVSTGTTSIMYYNVMSLDTLDKYIASVMTVFYRDAESGEHSILLKFHENKDITTEKIVTDEGNTTVTTVKLTQSYSDDSTVFICDDFTMTFYRTKGANIAFAGGTTPSKIFKISVTIENRTSETSDLNKCLYESTYQFPSYPSYVTRYYMDKASSPVYGDLNIIRESDLFDISIDELKERSLLLFGYSENGSSILLQFDPTTDENTLECTLFLITYVNGVYKKTAISVPLVCKLDELVNWKAYYNNTSQMLNNATKLAVRWKYQNIDMVAFWLFDNNIVTNRQYPLCLVTYRYLYSCLTSHKHISKSDYHVNGPKYDVLYPICLAIYDYDWENMCGYLPTEPTVTYEQMAKALIGIGIKPSPQEMVTPPNRVLEKLTNGDALYFLIKLHKIDDGAEEEFSSEFTFYLHVLIYMTDGVKHIKSLYNSTVYSLDSFLTCFDVDFDQRTIKETSSYNKRLIEYLLPRNTLYEHKELIPVFFYHRKYILTFYTNTQYPYKAISHELEHYIDYQTHEEFAYIGPEMITTLYVHAVSDQNTVILSDRYTLQSGKVTNVTVNEFVHPMITQTVTTDAKLQVDNKNIELDLGDTRLYGKYRDTDTSSWITVYNSDLDLGYNRGIAHLEDLHFYTMIIPLYNHDMATKRVISEYFMRNGYSSLYDINASDIVVIMNTSQVIGEATNMNTLLCMQFEGRDKNNDVFQSCKCYYAQSHEETGIFDRERYVTPECAFAMSEPSNTGFNISIHTTDENNEVVSSVFLKIKMIASSKYAFVENYTYTNFYYNYGTTAQEHTTVLFK